MRQSSLLLSTIGIFALACVDEHPSLDDEFSGDPLAQLEPVPEVLNPMAPQERGAEPALPPGVTQAESKEGDVICEVSDPAFRGAKTCLATCEVPCASEGAAAEIAAHIDTQPINTEDLSVFPRVEEVVDEPVEGGPSEAAVEELLSFKRKASTSMRCDLLAPADRGMGAKDAPVQFVAQVAHASLSAADLKVIWTSDRDGNLGSTAPGSNGTVQFPYSGLSIGTHVIGLTATDGLGETCTDYVLFTVGFSDNSLAAAPVASPEVIAAALPQPTSKKERKQAKHAPVPVAQVAPPVYSYAPVPQPTYAPAPAVALQPTYAPAPVAVALQPTYAPAPVAVALQPTYAPAPVAGAPQPTYAPAPVAGAPQPTYAAASVAPMYIQAMPQATSGAPQYGSPSPVLILVPTQPAAQWAPAPIAPVQAPVAVAPQAPVLQPQVAPQAPVLPPSAPVQPQQFAPQAPVLPPTGPVASVPVQPQQFAPQAPVLPPTGPVASAPVLPPQAVYQAPVIPPMAPVAMAPVYAPAAPTEVAPVSAVPVVMDPMSTPSVPVAVAPVLPSPAVEFEPVVVDQAGEPSPEVSSGRQGGRLNRNRSGNSLVVQIPSDIPSYVAPAASTVRQVAQVAGLPAARVPVEERSTGSGLNQRVQQVSQDLSLGSGDGRASQVTADSQVPVASAEIPPQTVASRVSSGDAQVLLLQPKSAESPIHMQQAVIRIPDMNDVERINHPPSVDLGGMGEGLAVLEGQSILFSARVKDSQDRPQNLRLRWVSDIDGEFHSGSPDAYGRVRFRHELDSPGEHRVTLYATDTEGLIGRSHIGIAVSSSPKLDVVLTPEMPSTADHLVARVRGPSLQDAANYATFSYQWYVDGELSGVSTSSTLPASATQKGQSWRVVINPPSSFSGWELGEQAVVIQNAPPIVSNVDVRLTDTSVTSSLTCQPGTGSDADGDIVEFTYSWEVNNIPIIGESNLVLDRAFFSMGGAVACIVTPMDGESTGQSIRSREVNVIRPFSTIEPDDENCRFGRRCK